MNIKSERMYTAPIPKMPPGLVELMEGLAKDVLKCNPPDVYSFCANHMKKLIEIRDGSTPKHVMTLEQKIAMANKKIRERAARRREDYDTKMQTYKKQSEIEKKKDYDNKGVDDYKSVARQYIKDKIVKIPEEDLTGDIEHEIIQKPSTPQSVVPTETALEELKPVYDDLLANVEDNSLIKVTENNGDNKIVEETPENLTDDEQKVILIKQMTGDELETVLNCEEKCLESFAEKQISTLPLIKNEVNLVCETLPNSYDHVENCKNKANLQVVTNSNIGISNVSIIVDEPKDLNDVEEREDNKNINLNNVDTRYIDQPILYSSLVTEEENTNKDQISSLFLDKKQDNTISTIPSEDDILISNNSELQNHVNNTSMDLETAAITIQKIFRKFLFRNKTLSTDDATNVDINSLIEDNNVKSGNDISSMNVSKDRRTLGLSRIDTVLQTVNEEKSLSQSTDDSSTLSSAATIIQAHVRGYLIRNKLNLNKNSSTTSGIDSDGLSFTSMEGDNDYRKNKTILNIHIVPESGHFMSRDESMLTSIDLSMDGSPPGSTNLHPLGYDRSERRKQLKREDAFQSISPPSNNSGKLSEDVDSVKEVLLNSENNKDGSPLQVGSGNTRTNAKEFMHDDDVNISTMVDYIDTALEVKSLGSFESPVKHLPQRPHSLPELTSDEMDVITPFTPSDIETRLIHSSEFHDVALPTQVSRSDTSVVRGE